MGNYANIAAILSSFAILGETGYLLYKTNGLKNQLEKRDYTINIFIGTLVGLIALGISIFFILRDNYNEQFVFTIILATVTVGLGLGIMSWFLSFLRMYQATSS